MASCPRDPAPRPGHCVSLASEAPTGVDRFEVRILWPPTMTPEASVQGQEFVADSRTAASSIVRNSSRVMLVPLTSLGSVAAEEGDALPLPWHHMHIFQLPVVVGLTAMPRVHRARRSSIGGVIHNANRKSPKGRLVRQNGPQPAAAAHGRRCPIRSRRTHQAQPVPQGPSAGTLSVLRPHRPSAHHARACISLSLSFRVSRLIRCSRCPAATWILPDGRGPDVPSNLRVASIADMTFERT